MFEEAIDGNNMADIGSGVYDKDSIRRHEESLRCVRFDVRERKFSVERLFELMAPSARREEFNDEKEPSSSSSQAGSFQEGGSIAQFVGRFDTTEEGLRFGQAVIEGTV